jgi:hypothetical protein
LEVEEAREYSSWEEEEKVKVKAREPLERTRSPFYQTRGAGYISEEREIGRGVVHARQV